MDSNTIAIISLITSSVFALIAVLISFFTLKQNNKMVEESTRPTISIYPTMINPGSLMYYLVIRNFGSSAATITSLDSSFEFVNCYCFSGLGNRNYIKELIGSTIAPNQSISCRIDYDKVPDKVTFNIKYKSSTKSYKETFNISMKSTVNLPTTKYATDDKELLSISYSLQEIIQKML